MVVWKWCIKKALNTMWDKDKKCACLHFNGSTRSANIMKNPEINDTSSLLSLLFEGISLSQQKGIFNIFCWSHCQGPVQLQRVSVSWDFGFGGRLGFTPPTHYYYYTLVFKRWAAPWNISYFTNCLLTHYWLALAGWKGTFFITCFWDLYGKSSRKFFTFRPR